MSARILFSTTRRVLTQLRHDRRTVALIILCGLFAPREQMAGWMHALSNAMPLTYAVQGLQEVGRHAEATGLMWRDLTIVAGCIVLALSLAAATLRRRTD